jgi:hypothetical protein
MLRRKPGRRQQVKTTTAKVKGGVGAVTDDLLIGL